MRRRHVATMLAVAIALSAPAPQASNAATSWTLIGAGDIAVCGPYDDNRVGALINQQPGTVFTAGDNAYRSGTAEEFGVCYQRAWGAFKSRTRPSPGNHDYVTTDASAYFAYFGAAAGPANLGYYAYDLGPWRVYSLNSERMSSTQTTWLKADLAANPRQCVAAYFHRPLFSSGSHGNSASVRPLWDALHAAGAELVINGHDHNYERFRPQTPAGVASASGIREFVVGTGGVSQRAFGSVKANSVVRHTGTWGALKLTLTNGAYSWRFLRASGTTFTDSGSGNCH